MQQKVQYEEQLIGLHCKSSYRKSALERTEGLNFRGNRKTKGTFGFKPRKHKNGGKKGTFDHK